jgi:molybdopterin-binding protein
MLMRRRGIAIITSLEDTAHKRLKRGPDLLLQGEAVAAPQFVAMFFQLAPRQTEMIMRLSARNQLKGTVTKVTKGATTSHVVVDIGDGQTVTSSITNESVDELGIKKGGKVTVVIKASDVMIGVD